MKTQRTTKWTKFYWVLQATVALLSENAHEPSSFVSGISNFLRETVKNCSKNGYVQTLMGRRRFLPGITSTSAHAKAHVSARNFNNGLRVAAAALNDWFLSFPLAQAERQAVNTTVQGSAADIVKTATVNIHKRLRQTYPLAPLSHQHLHQGDFADVCHHVCLCCYHPKVCEWITFDYVVRHAGTNNQRRATTSRLRGAFFILQLHDELIYETTEMDVIQVRCH